MKHLGDITKLHGYDIEPVDCITGGSPCQDLSLAGKRAGLAGERSGLFMEQIRIVKEMRDATRHTVAVRPRYLVWENVPGAMSSNRGNDFQAVLTEIIRIAEPKAPDVPMPGGGGGGQRQDASTMRWEDGQLLGEFTMHSFGESPREENASALSQILEACPPLKYSLSGKACAGILSRADRRGKELPKALRMALERQSASKNEQGSQGGGKGILIQDNKAASIRTQQNQSVMVYTREFGGNVHKGNITPTLEAAMGEGGNNMPIVFENHSQDTRYTPLGDICQTVSATYGMGGNNQPLVVNEPVCIGNGQLDQLKMNDKVGALNCMHDQQAVMSQHIRRLTPLECERLQGYPDNWTDIGEWTDTKGKRHKTADSARYKALGNSIALPFWFWLLRRISAQYERPATLGSLFDGIGGFPLCWEKCNGKGTARWASEIEEFPIAVTKIRFGED